ncbi:MAG: hypothetical protein GX288_11420 [Clostridiales bacterium]|nr:hypothetical protein [Clostridiales bacterium]
MISSALLPSSSNEKVAKVDSDGKVTAQGTGIAVIRTEITLYSGKIKTVSTIIHVRKPYIKITKSTEVMKVGDTFTFDAKGYGVADKEIQWSTSKKSRVVIGKNSGKATAESKGTDYVVAKVGDITKQIKVVVK